MIFSHLIDRVPTNPASGGDQTLILVHRRELVEQAVRHCAAVYPQKRIDIEMGKQHASGVADITVASVQSINSGDRLRKFDPKRFKLVLVDEAHHIVASSYKSVLQYMGLWQGDDHTDSPALVGVSATMSRFDGIKLGAALDHIVYHKDYIDMIEDKWLTNIIFTTVKSHVDLSKVGTNSFGDYQIKNLSLACNTEHTNEITVRSWMSSAKGRNATLVFCVDTAHVQDLANTFRWYGFDARYVLGTTDRELRFNTLEQFKEGRFPVLLNCGVFTEGTDIPNVDCVLLARPTRSRNLLIQMIGRGMRLHEQKQNCHVIDMVASLDTGIITVPTLFGLDPDRMVEDASIDDLRKLSDDRTSHNVTTDVLGNNAKPTGTISRVSFTDYDSIEDLLEDKSGDRHIRSMSKHAWVEVGKDRYVLSSNSGDLLTIDKDEARGEGPAYRVRLNQKAGSASKFKEKWRPLRRAEEIASAHSLETAVHAADTFAANSSLFTRAVVARTANWRGAPASEGQLEFLKKVIGTDSHFDGEAVTKGEAADMITKIKHGARGRFEKLAASARRVKQQQARVEELRNRERVEVGPVAS